MSICAGQDLAAQIAELLDGLGGWCTEEKARVIAELVLERDLRTAVEIGVFAGRSLLPVAWAMRRKGTGLVFGVENWSCDTATQFEHSAVNDAWWTMVDFMQIKRMFIERLLAADLLAQVRIIEAPSERAHHLFDSIDFLHIDGGHSVIGAILDVVNFLPKLRGRGILVFDDVDWETTQPALTLVEHSGCRVIAELRNSNNQVACRIFEKDTQAVKAWA